MNITNREKEVLYLISYGHTIKEIAQLLYISPHTALSHKKSLFEKLKVHNAPQLVRAGFAKKILYFLSLMTLSTIGFSQNLIDIEGDINISGKIKTEIGNKNTIIGQNNAQNLGMNASFNSIIGYEAARDLTDGSHNIILGYWAGLATNGDSNVFIGNQAGKFNEGFKNTLIGNLAGLESDGNNLTIIGAESGTLNSASRSIALGYQAKVGCDNCAAIGGTDLYAVDVGIGLSNPQTPLHIKNKLDGALNPEAITIEDIDDTETWELYTFGNFLAFDRNGVNVAYIDPSDGSYYTTVVNNLKKNISPLENVLNRIKKLEAYTYQLKGQNDTQSAVGVIAQELESAFPELIKTIGKQLYVNYDSFGPIAIQAIKEQQQIIDALRETNDVLSERIKRIEDLISGLAKSQK